MQCEGCVHCLDDEPGVHRVWMPHREAPGLAMSHTFGDYCIKDYDVISAPEVTQRRITARDQFVILATDGTWSSNCWDQIHAPSSETHVFMRSN